MNQTKGLKEDVKVVVNSLLVPHANGLTLERFMKEYADCEMKPFPYRQLGYNTPQAFLFSIPDVVRCTTLASGHILLQAQSNKNVSHIQELVHGQKSSQKGSSRVISRLLRDQPFFNKHNNAPPAHYGDRNYRPQNYSMGPRRLTGGHNTYSMNIRPPQIIQPVPVFQQNMTIPPRTCSSLEAEFQLVEDFKKLFQSFPNGVEISSIYELYSNMFRKPLLFQQIQEGLTATAFFEKHPEVFRVWRNVCEYMVALKESHLEMPKLACGPPLNVPPPPIQGNLMEAPPIKPDIQTIRTTPSPAKVIFQSSAGHSVKPKWVAADIRTQGPGVSTLQTVTVGWNNSKPPTPNQFLPKVTPVPWRPPPRSDNGTLPAAFGVTKPKVKNVYEPDTEITRQEFPTDVGDFDYFFIIVAEVFSPGEFYWFLSENKKAIESLTDDMTIFYNVNHEYVITRNEMYIGQLVAAMYTDNLWYRARILGCNKHEFRVFFVDYGSQNSVTIEQIRHLSLHFTQMPIQAFRGRIFGISPLPTERKWSYEAGRLFLNLVKGSKVMAAAKMFEESITNSEGQVDTVYSLTLVDTTTKGTDVHVNDYLIDNGFAAANDEDIASLQVYAAAESVAGSSTTESTMSAPSPSPLPTCAFPSLASNVPLPFEEFTTPSPVFHGKPSVSPLGHLKADIPSSNLSNGAVSVPPKTPLSLSLLSLEENGCVNKVNRCSAKQLVLKDDRKLYVVEFDGDLYLPRFDMLMLIPNLERQIDALNMKIDHKTIEIKEHPHIFNDLNKVGAPWIHDDKKEIVSKIHLFPLNHVLPLFFLLGVKDKVVTSAIEAELKQFNDASTA